LGLHGRSPAEVNKEILAALRRGGTQVLTIHAEVEGRVCRREFTDLLHQVRDQGIGFIRLIDYAQELWRHPEQIIRASMGPGTLPGRAGTVACQSRREDEG
jgi:undecaprenyl phosphate-alpha-L-ara4FN deformylase